MYEMGTVTHDIAISFDQPDDVLNRLLAPLQQKLNQPVTRTSKGMLVRDARTVLIVDAQGRRRQYLAGLLIQAGFRCLPVKDALEAFTLFIQGTYLPFVVITGQEDKTKHFFLQRLLQQMERKYDWEMLLLHVHTVPSSTPHVQQPPVTPMPQMPFQMPGQMPPQVPSSPSSASSVPPQAPFQMPSQPPSSPASSQPQAPFQMPAQMPPQTPFTPAAPDSPSQQQPQFRPPMPAQGMPPARYPFQMPPQAPTGPTTESLPPQFPFPEPSSQMPGTAVPNTPSTNSATPSRRSGPGSVSSALPTSGPLQDAPVEKKVRPRVSLEGQSLGRYRVEKQIGKSDHSAVYQTYDRLREKDVALKAIQTDSVPYYVMEKSAEDITIFQQEAELLANLDHAHILPIWNYGKSYISGSPFIYKTMPYCPEGSLAHWLVGHGGARAFSAQEVMHVILQLADALQYLHSQQLLYQNFKLTNVLVRNQSKKMQSLDVALCDINTIQDGAFHAQMPATFAYMAPECWNGQASPESDQYGLAVMTYELLTGRQPFQGNAEYVMKLLHTTMQPQPPTSLNPSLPLPLNSVLLRALAKTPGERFASLALFAATLQRACGV